MNTGDPASLQNLNDIVAPGPVPWWPPAPGWYVVLLVLAGLLLWGLFRFVRWWRRNGYRREALRELKEIRSAGTVKADRLPVLLKRAALSAWPRAEVAALTGEEWHAFLDRTAETGRFCSGSGESLDRLAWASGSTLTNEEFGRVLKDSAWWLKHHRAEQEG
jgi:hypothetical protein